MHMPFFSVPRAISKKCSFSFNEITRENANHPLTYNICLKFFSSPKPKAQMSFFDRHLSVVRRRRWRRRLKLFHIFIFFSRTTGPILTILGTKHHWVTGIQVFFFT